MPLARILGNPDPDGGAPPQARPLPDRPEPPLEARGHDDERRRLRRRLVRRGRAAAALSHTHPAWNDRNLRELAAGIRSPLFFSHIRASTGTAIQETNVHPFRYENWLWMHNGLIREFHTVKRELVLAVDAVALHVHRGHDGLRGDVLPRAHVRPQGRSRARRRAHGRASSRRRGASTASSIRSR